MRLTPTLVLVVLWAAPSCAVASIIETYTSAADWNTATAGGTTFNFEGIAANNSFVFYPTPPGITRDGVNFTIDHSQSNGDLFVLGQGWSYPGISVLSTQQSTSGNNNILITLPNPATSIGLELGTGNPPVTLKLSNGDSVTVPSQPFPHLGFFGLTDTQPITSLEISNGVPVGFDVRSFSFGNVSPCTAALENAVSTFTIDGNTRMQATFTPNGGLSLAQAEAACGVVTFDWQQTITNLPDPSPYYRADGIHMTSASTPFFDPVPTGWPGYPSSADNFPFYFNAFNGQLQGYETTNTLSFSDAPADSCLPGGNAAACNGVHAPAGSFLGFTTQLVGVYSDGTFVVFPSALNDWWTWKDYFNGTAGGIATTYNLMPVDPGSGTGGITITDGAGAVPEPSCIVLFCLGISGIWLMRQKVVGFR